jgi:threonine dehydrogenase-like Zn-dependent dehydrogenase
MKAYVYTKPFTIECQERPIPEPRAGEVRIKVKAVSICGSDTGGFKGTSAMRIAPLVIGHEFAGQVDATGSGVDPAKKGLRVGVYPNIACGKCPDCKAGLPNICDYRFIPGTTMPAGGMDGAFEEYVCVPEKNLIPLPDSMSFEEASCFEPASVGLRGARKMGDITGKTVAIFGAGPIGLMTLQSVKLCGAGKLIVIDVQDNRLELAKKLGAWETVNSAKCDAVAKVKELTDGRGAAATADCVGIAASINASIKMTMNGGIVSMIGMGAANVDGFEYKDCVAREITLAGSYCYVEELWEIRDLLAAGKYDFKSLITCVAPMSGIQAKMEDLTSGHTKEVKVVLTD